MGEKKAVQKSSCWNSISYYLFEQILISQFPQESYHFFELKYILFLFFQRQLTKGLNFPYRTYSFRAVFKFHSFCTLSKALVFLVHVFTLKCLKILLWMDSHSHKPRIINVFNAKIAKIFSERLISCWKFFPKFHVTYRIGVGYHFLLYHFKQNIFPWVSCFPISKWHWKLCRCYLYLSILNREISAQSCVCHILLSFLFVFSEIVGETSKVILEILEFFHWKSLFVSFIVSFFFTARNFMLQARDESHSVIDFLVGFLFFLFWFLVYVFCGFFFLLFFPVLFYAFFFISREFFLTP